MKWLVLATLAVGKSPDLTADDLENPFNFMTGGALSASPEETAADDMDNARTQLRKAEQEAKMATLQVQEATEDFTAHGRSASALRKQAKGQQLTTGAEQHLQSGLTLLSKAHGESTSVVSIDDEHLQEDAQNAVNALQSAVSLEKDRARDAAPARPVLHKRHRHY
jgi:hypothetical protein